MAKNKTRPQENLSAPSDHRYLRRGAKIILLSMVALTFYLFFHFHLSKYLSIASLKEHQAAIHERYRLEPFSALAIYAVFAMLYVVCSLPAASIPMLISGALFGVWVGTLICTLSLAAGAVISLLMSRFIFRDFVRRRFAKKVAVMEREYEKSGTHYLIALRMIPLMPYMLTNLVFGLTPIPIVRFWIITVIAAIPAIFLYASAGTELAKINSPSDILNARLIITLIALAILPFAARWLIQSFSKRRSPKA